MMFTADLRQQVQGPSGLRIGEKRLKMILKPSENKNNSFNVLIMITILILTSTRWEKRPVCRRCPLLCFMKSSPLSWWPSPSSSTQHHPHHHNPRHHHGDHHQLNILITIFISTVPLSWSFTNLSISNLYIFAGVWRRHGDPKYRTVTHSNLAKSSRAGASH